MESKLLLALFIAGLLAFSAAHDGDSNGSDSGSDSMGSAGDSFEKQDDDCDRLVEGSDDNDGKCDLTDGLEEVPDKVDCTEEEKTTIKEWIIKLKLRLKVKKTVQERLIIALSCIQEFEMEYPKLFDLIKFQNVSSWGYLASFTKVIEYRQSLKIESIFSLDDEDNCPLFDALLNGTDGSYEQTSAVNAFINETLIKICGDMSLSVTKKSVLIYKAIAEFFSINSEWQLSFFKFEIHGFGSFQQFFEVTRTFYQQTQIDVILEGEVIEECQFMISFKFQLDLILSDSSFTPSEKSTMKSFYKLMLQELKLCGKSGKSRLVCIMKLMRKFAVLYKVDLLWSIQIEGFGSFFDVYSCGPGKVGLPSKPTVMIPTMASPKPTCSCTCGASTTLMA